MDVRRSEWRIVRVAYRQTKPGTARPVNVPLIEGKKDLLQFILADPTTRVTDADVETCARKCRRGRHGSSSKLL